MSNKQKIGLRRPITVAFTFAIMMATVFFAWLPRTEFGKAYAYTETAVVTADVLNVRSGPGIIHSRIGSLKNGKTFTVSGSDKDWFGTEWYKFSYGSRTAYVSSKYVNIERNFTSEDEKLTGVVNDGPLRIRTGPSTGYKILGTFSKGKTVTIEGKAKNTSGSWWYKINYNGRTGYLYSSYVTIQDKRVSEALSATGVVNDGPLRVRTGPSTGYKILGTFSKGKTVTIEGKEKINNGSWWYKIKYNGTTAYICASYVTIKAEPVEEPKKEEPKKEEASETTTPATDTSKDASTETKKEEATETTTPSTDTKKEEASETTKPSTEATESSSQTTETTATPKEAVAEIVKTSGVIADGPLRVRTGPGTSYKILAELATGKAVTIEGKEKSNGGVWWYKITYNGKTGYICSSYVSTNADSIAEIVKTTGTIADGPLRVRTGPGTSYKIITELATGKSVTIDGKEKSSGGVWWYKITYNEMAGYICSTYVKLPESSTESSTNSTTAQTTQTEQNKDTSKQESTSEQTAEPVSFELGTTTANEGLNVRTGPGTNYTRIDTIAKGTSVTILGSEKASNGKLWYKYQYSASQIGYLCSDYVTVKTVTSDGDFEAYMTAQGFPESYKAGLRMLHAAHPQWVFKALKLDYSWSSALSKETAKPGTNLVSPSSPVSYRSTVAGAYNSSTGAWTKYDTSWYAADSRVVAYYMDPRNFLSENGIYQFMTHRYDASTQNESTVAAVISGSFMQGKNPGGGYSSYTALINEAGKNTGVNPNVLAAMIIQEQGWGGSSLSSGTYSGYEGYYNFFNIGAYTTSSMNAIQRGLWYAKQQGWDTPYKAIVGGAQFYANNYVNNNQDTYYTKKFNVKNGLSKVATHQYMTNVSGAASEGSLLKRAFNSNNSYSVSFEIPVYADMPATACQLP